MILDSNLRLMGTRTADAATFSAAGVPTGVPTGQDIKSTCVSANTVDLTDLRDIGTGRELAIRFTVTAAATRAAGAIGTVFSVILDDDAALGSPTTIASTPSIAKADLGLGAVVDLPIPPYAYASALRYLGAAVTNANAADSFNAVADIVELKSDGTKIGSYPIGYVVA